MIRLHHLLQVSIFFVQSFSQVLQYERDQPVLFIPESSACCSTISASSEALFNCIQNASTKLVNAKFTIVSYSTKDILNYAAFSSAVNLAYAEQNSYGFELTSPESGFEYDKTDQRWNKVRILLEYVQRKESVFIVWLDSDLIVLDLGIKLELIVEQNIDSDVIISLDAEPESIFSIVNTGFVIVKSSEWSESFLKAWWGNSTR